jgi:hypothetical protein
MRVSIIPHRRIPPDVPAKKRSVLPPHTASDSQELTARDQPGAPATPPDAPHGPDTAGSRGLADS